MKKVVGLFLVIFMLISVLFVGCGQSSNQPASTNNNSDNNKQTVLRIAWWGSQDRHDRTLKVIQMFEQKYPNIKIEPEYTGWDGYWSKMAAESAGGNLPDVIQMDYQYIKQYTQKNLLLDLTPYVKDKKLNLSDVSESSLTGGKLNGKLYAINLGDNAGATIYDPAIFQKAGVPEPNPNWTWEDWMNTVKKIKEVTGLYGDDGMPGPGYLHGLRIYLRQHGQKLFATDDKKLGFENDKYFSDFFNMEVDLMKAKALPTMAERLEIKSPEDSLIVKGKAAMTEQHACQLIAISKAANRPLKLALIPNAKDQVKKGMFVKPSMFFSVYSKSKNKDAAIKFIDYFTNDVEANKVLAAERGVPISSKVREAIKGDIGPVATQVFEYIDLVRKNSTPIDPPEPPQLPQIDSLLKTLEQKITFFKITPVDAAKQFRSQVNSLLSGN